MNDEARNRFGFTPETLGLSATSASARLRAGRNILVPTSNNQKWRRWVGPLQDPMVILLLIATPIYFSLNERAEALATLIALLPIILVGWALEARAERTLDKLRNLVAPTCEVLRDHKFKRISVEELVVDDVVALTEGQVIPADCRLIERIHINVDESSLTGESLPVEKTAGEIVLAGTTVNSGRCLVQVIRTGSETTYGSMSGLIAKSSAPRTPLQQAVGQLVKTMALGAVLFAIMVGVVEFARNQSVIGSLLASVSLLIAAVPEEFSIVYSLYLSLGAWKMTKENALVRNLPGVETLGSVTVICSDKTGTLTQGKVVVSDVVGFGLDEKSLLEIAVLASAPNPFDSLDQAIVEAALAAGINVEQLHNMPLIRSWPFNPVNPYMTQEWQKTDGVLVVAKGAYEKIIEIVDGFEPEPLKQRHDELTRKGTRVLAIGQTDIHRSTGDRSSDENGMQLVGLIGFQDPIRPEATKAIQQAKKAGIRVVMITGDHPATARSIATELGIGGNASELVVHTGNELEVASRQELDALAAATDVFARTRPTEKHLLVESLKRQGEVVAMTGDGVNDAAALRSAHIGVAMGKRGTDVAREAATMVLLDDNFATIVSATRNGRRIYDNLVRAFAYLIAVHVPLVLLAFVIPLIGLPLLLVPMQLIVFEVLLHPIVSLVFEVEPEDDDIMSRPPRASQFALSWSTLWRPLLLGFTLATTITGIFALSNYWLWTDEQSRGLGFVTLLLAQPFMILATRAGKIRIWRFRRRLTREFIGATIVVIATVCIALLTPFGSLLNLTSFPAIGWLLVFFAIGSSVLIPELFKTSQGRFDHPNSEPRFTRNSNS